MFNFRASNSLLKGLIALGLFATTYGAIADDTVDESEWKFAGEIYLWAPEISGTSITGGDFKISFDEILSNLDMTVMGRIGARKGKLTLFTDIIHLSLEGDEKGSFNIPIGPSHELTVGDKLTIGLKTWIVQPTAAYTVFEAEKYNIDLLAGARYLWTELDLDLRTTGSFAGKKVGTTQSEHNWDGVVGVMGKMALSDKWDAIAYVDGGTGDSDYTLQGQAALSYKFDNFEGRFGYRYLKWEFDSHQGVGNLMEDLTVKGPYAGALFKF